MDPNQLAPELDERNGTSREEVPAWEEIAVGRYMPRRIRGSFRDKLVRIHCASPTLPARSVVLPRPPTLSTLASRSRRWCCP